MNIYFAPLEGITGYVFRNVFNRYFGKHIDKYFTPFIMAHEKCGMSPKEVRDILPENNLGINIVPQVMTNSSSEYLFLEEQLREYGYEEINLNFGCPSKTVTTRQRGAGILNDLSLLERFLDEVMSNTKCNISVKTRLGICDPDEFDYILDIYNKYNFSELIIHPRVQYEMYKGLPHYESFDYSILHSRNCLVYNGNIFDSSSKGLGYQNSQNVAGLMIGRGLIANPSLADELYGDVRASKECVMDYLDDLCNEYCKVNSGETPVLFKMKEIWNYMSGQLGPDAMYEADTKNLKKLMKTKSLSEYKILQRNIFY